MDYRKPFKGIRIASNIEIVVGIEITFFETSGAKRQFFSPCTKINFHRELDFVNFALFMPVEKCDFF